MIFDRIENLFHLFRIKSAVRQDLLCDRKPCDLVRSSVFVLNMPPYIVKKSGCIDPLFRYLLICFQIKDDIFDYFDSKEIGKPTGNDMLEGKLTLPALYVLNNTKDDAAREIAIKVKDGTATPDEIARLIAFIKESGGIEYAIQTMNLYKEKALGLLASLPDSDVCTALRAYLNYVVDREK